MSATCAHPVEWETLVAYWANDLGSDEVEVVEAHVMSCGDCTASSGRVAVITESIRSLIPPILTLAQLEAARARGVRVEENRMSPGQRTEVLFRHDVELLAHRLVGLDMSRSERVAVRILAESTGALIFESLRAPFDRDVGEVIVACQKHFRAFPHDVVIEVEAIEPGGASTRATYTIPHRFEGDVAPPR